MELAEQSVDANTFAAPLLTAHAQCDGASLFELVEAIGVARVVRWLRRSAGADGPVIVATLARLQPKWRRALVRAGATDLLITAMEPGMKRVCQVGDTGGLVEGDPGQVKRQKTQQHYEDIAPLMAALRLLAPMIDTKLRNVVKVAVLAYTTGVPQLKWTALETLRELSAKPQVKPMMLESGVVALCVKVLEQSDVEQPDGSVVSVEAAIHILSQLSVSSPLGALEAEAEDREEHSEKEEDSDVDMEDENSARGIEVDVRALLNIRQKGALGSSSTFESPADWFKRAPGSRMSKLTTVNQVIKKNASVKRFLNPLLPPLVGTVVLGTEEEQLAAASLIGSLIYCCKQNTVTALRAGAVGAFLRMFRTHTDVVAAVSALERFIRHLSTIRCGEAKDATQSVLEALLAIVQDLFDDQAPVAIELVCLLSTTRSLHSSLLDAGVIQVWTKALDALMEPRNHGGAVLLRHVTTMVANMAKTTSIRGEIVDEGVLDKWICLLKRAPAGSRSEIALAISHLVDYTPVKIVIASSGTLTVLVQMMCSCVEPEGHAAAEALAAACSACSSNVALIPHADIADRCVQWLSAESRYAHEPALRLLAVLAADDQSRPSVVTHRLSSYLATVIAKGSTRAKRFAANLVEALARDESSHRRLLASGLLGPLTMLTSDAHTRRPAEAALHVLVDTWPPTMKRKGSDATRRMSRTTGKVYYCDVITGETQWESQAPVGIHTTTESDDADSRSAIIQQLIEARGARLLLKALSSTDHGAALEPIVDLLRRLGNADDASKVEIKAKWNVLSHLACHGTDTLQIAAAKAIVELVPASKWLETAAAQSAVVDAYVRQFESDASLAQAVKNAQLLVRKLQETDSVVTNSALTAFFGALVGFVRSNVNLRASLALELLEGWIETPKLTHAAVGAGVPALCVFVFKQLSNTTTMQICGVVQLRHAVRFARALIVNGFGEKLVEEGALECLIATFTAFHQTLAAVGGERSNNGQPAIDWLSFVLMRQSSPADITSEIEFFESLGPIAEYGKVWRRHLLQTTILLTQLARKVPCTRPVIGASSCIPILLALIDRGSTDDIRASRDQYIKLLAAVCLDCPESVRQVPHLRLVTVCVGLLKPQTPDREQTAALALLHSLARDQKAGPEVATMRELTNAIVDTFRREHQVGHTNSIERAAIRVVAALMLYAPSRSRLEEAGIKALLKEVMASDSGRLNANEALPSLHHAELATRHVSTEMSACERDGFVMVDVHDCELSGTEDVSLNTS